ncbi:MAG: hypothetical protein JO319_13160, partial [Acidobacteriaceae bacterium]|nr:hypothetical protein [Acidobacteriaceae bacterium]
PRPVSTAAVDGQTGTELEDQIAKIWRQVLSLPSVGLDDSFFDVGGTSLTLALVEDRLRAIVTKPFTMTDLFRYPSVRALARFLSARQEDQQSALVGAAAERARRQRSALWNRPSPLAAGERSC